MAVSTKSVRIIGAKRPGLRSSSRMSGPGMARRQQLINGARRMLQSMPLGDVSLVEVAKRAKVARGSAYFFYEDVNALLMALVGVIDEELQACLRAPLPEPVTSWQGVVAVLVERGSEFLKRDLAACQLLIGKDAPPALKYIDRANDVVLGRIMEEHIAARFEMPSMPNRPKLFYRAIEVADVMLCLSMIEHGHITKEYAGEACRAATAYLATYLPAKLPVKRRSARPQVEQPFNT